MKKLFYVLPLILSLLFAPFVFGVSAGLSVPELPGYLFPGINIAQPDIGIDCRDVILLQSSPVTFLNQQTYTLTESVDHTALLRIAQVKPINHKEAAYQTDRTVYYVSRTGTKNIYSFERYSGLAGYA